LRYIDPNGNNVAVNGIEIRLKAQPGLFLKSPNPCIIHLDSVVSSLLVETSVNLLVRQRPKVMGKALETPLTWRAKHQTMALFQMIIRIMETSIDVFGSISTQGFC